MKVLRPTAFAQAMLISSNATETYATYSAATSYALAARVVYGMRVYESLIASNLEHTPDVSPTWWLDYGPSNTYAMVDSQVSTVTTKTTSLVVTLATGVIDTLYLGNLSGYSVQVQVRDGLGGTLIYDSTQNLAGALVGDWYQYFFFDPLIQRTQALFRDIPPYGSSHVTITLTGTGVVSMGAAVFGRLYDIGGTQYGAKAGIMDFSRKDTDAYGTTTFVKRAWSKRLTVPVMVPRASVNRVQRMLYDMRATPAVWIGSEDPSLEEPLVVYGFYRDFSSVINYLTHAQCDLEIEGLI